MLIFYEKSISPIYLPVAEVYPEIPTGVEMPDC